MGTERTTLVRAKPGVEWFAGRIGDPVERLKFLQMVNPLTTPRKSRVWASLGLAVALLALLCASLVIARAAARVRPAAVATKPLPAIRNIPVSKVWLVDKAAESETYSNGLRVDTRFEASNHPRSYLVFPAIRAEAGAAVRQNRPAGIVFHTTESRQLPFEASANGALKRIGQSLVEYVGQIHAYHYLIDRFGRVYRIVPESDSANHAGYSVWSDEQWLYLNLNQCFLGVSFEAQTEPGQSDATVSPAQIRSAATLTEMLRDKYAISAANCVTHAQVSVNPDNMRVGYHTDWASAFPFEQLGLPDNYARPLPALTDFGFQYDATFQYWAGTRLYAGVELADQELDRRAQELGQSPAAFRKAMRARYRRLLEATRRIPSATREETGDAN